MTTSGYRIGLIQFPGSNCDQDCIDVFKREFNINLRTIWHTERQFEPLDAVILPGGFSYGDYLRGGALAARTPIIQAVVTHAQQGRAVLGICNGWQILTEAQILPGTLLRNAQRRFICTTAELTVAPGSSVFHRLQQATPLRVPIAHGEGRFYIDDDGLRTLHDQQRIVFRYASNPNGSCDDIAGVCSPNGRILGLMPHPERAVSTFLGGSDDGLKILRAFLSTFL